MENKTKSTQTFLCQGNLATCFAPGKLRNDTQISTAFLPEEKSKAQRTLNYRNYCTKRKIQPGGYLLLQGPTCYSIRTFLIVDRICEHSL